MPISLYDMSVPVFLRYLDRIVGLIESAERFVRERECSPNQLLGARLAADMLPFEQQVVIAINFTLRASYPLAGASIPPYGNFPDTFDGLRARAERAKLLLRTLQSSQFVGGEARVLESRAGEALVRLPASEFLLQYALPNFFFHVSAAYAVLRNQGVMLGKKDFDAFHVYSEEPSSFAGASSHRRGAML